MRAENHEKDALFCTMMHFGALEVKFSVVQGTLMKMVSAFFLIICRSTRI